MTTRFIKADELAAVLQISRRHAYALAEEGAPHYRFGRSVRFVATEVIEWARQTASEPLTSQRERDKDGSNQEKRKLLRTLSVHGPGDGESKTIYAVDW